MPVAKLICCVFKLKTSLTEVEGGEGEKRAPLSPCLNEHLNCDPHSLSCHQHPQLTRALAEPSTGHSQSLSRARVNAKQTTLQFILCVLFLYFLLLASTGKASGQKEKAGHLRSTSVDWRIANRVGICAQETKTKIAYLPYLRVNTVRSISSIRAIQLCEQELTFNGSQPQQLQHSHESIRCGAFHKVQLICHMELWTLCKSMRTDWAPGNVSP